MKRIPESKVARWPQSITKLALIYACCFVLTAMISFSVCYAYFSAKVEATGNITVGKLEIQYVDSSSTTLSTLQTTITRNGSVIQDDEEEEDLIIPKNFTIIPGDTINIVGNVKNTGSIDAYVVLQAEFMLMSTDGKTVEKTFDSKFYDLSGTQITYDTLNKIYSTPATALSVDGVSNLSNANLSYVVNTGLTSEYSGRTFKLKLTTLAIQSENLEEDTKYSSLAVQATNMMLTSTPHLVTDAKIYGNSVQNVGSGRNIFNNYGYSANNITDPDATRALTNSYGTTISTTEASNSITVTQTQYSDDVDYVGHYKNGYFCIGVYGLEPEVTYTLSFDINITNRLSDTLDQLGISPNGAGSLKAIPLNGVTNGRISISFTHKAYDLRQELEIRVNGMSFTMSNIQIEQGETATEYEPYAGKNLLPYPYASLSKTANDLTFTSNTDGSITINGTSTASTNFILSNGTTYATSIPFSKGIYTFSMNAVENVEFAFGVHATEDSSRVVHYARKDTNYIQTITIDNDTTRIDFIIVVRNANVTFDNVVIYPQIEYGTVATAYEPYVGSPSPEAPAKIESVGERTKNLFDGIFEKGVIYATTGEAVSSSSYTNIITKNFIPVQPNTQYTMTNGILNINQKTRFYDSDKNYIGSNLASGRLIASGSLSLTQTGTTPANAYFMKFELDFNDVTTGQKVVEGEYKYQLELGDTATEYEPYGYKIPVTTRGKNLLNIDEGVAIGKQLVKNNDGSYTITREEISSNRFSATMYVNLKANTLYTFSYQLIETTATYPLRIYSVDGGSPIFYASLGSDSNSRTFKPSRDVTAIRIYLESSEEAGVYTTFKNLMIEEGATATEYEPYIGNVTHTIYLDEPLRKVGDVADYIEIKDGVAKVVRKVQKLYMADFTNWATWGVDYQEEGITGFYSYYNVNNITVGTDTTAISNIQSSNTNIWGGKKVGIENNKGGYLMLCLYNDQLADVSSNESAVESLKIILQQTNAYVYCVRATDYVEYIQLDDMFTLAGDTIYEFDTVIQPSDYYFS